MKGGRSDLFDYASPAANGNETFARSVFQRDYWLLDVAACSFLAALVGFVLQLETNSERGNPANLHWIAAALSVASYLIAGALGRYVGRSVAWLPSWVWVVGIGTALFEIWNSVLLVAWKGVNPNSVISASEQMSSYIFDSARIGKVVTAFVLFAPFFLGVVFVTRLAAFLAFRVRKFFFWIR